jgi:hypothetical protein
MHTTIRRTALIALIALLATSFAASAATLVGSGRAKTENRAVGAFTGVAISVPGRLELTQGATDSVAITADDNVLPELETVVEKGVLEIRIRTKNLHIARKSEIRIAVSIRAIESLAVAGSANVAAGPLQAAKLSVKVAGSGDVKIASLTAQELVANIAGSGDLAVAGRADTFTANAAGSGSVRADKLETKRAKVAVAGSGSVVLIARESLNASIAGSGDVRYYGDPKVERSVVGSGSVKRLGPVPS